MKRQREYRRREPGERSTSRERVEINNDQERREERYENLLHELSRKEKEEKERNIIDRDRLGFDDESFKYGQKRKKS